jgi:hypothetical protein
MTLRLPQTLFDLLHLPFLDSQISSDRLVKKIGAVAILSVGQRIERINLVRVKSKTDSMFSHMMGSYHKR